MSKGAGQNTGIQHAVLYGGDAQLGGYGSA